ICYKSSTTEKLVNSFLSTDETTAKPSAGARPLQNRRSRPKRRRYKRIALTKTGVGRVRRSLLACPFPGGRAPFAGNSLLLAESRVHPHGDLPILALGPGNRFK